jgi:hypothetical protein
MRSTALAWAAALGIDPEAAIRVLDRAAEELMEDKNAERSNGFCRGRKANVIDLRHWRGSRCG